MYVTIRNPSSLTLCLWVLHSQPSLTFAHPSLSVTLVHLQLLVLRPLESQGVRVRTLLPFPMAESATGGEGEAAIEVRKRSFVLHCYLFSAFLSFHPLPSALSSFLPSFSQQPTPSSPHDSPRRDAAEPSRIQVELLALIALQLRHCGLDRAAQVRETQHRMCTVY